MKYGKFILYLYECNPDAPFYIPTEYEWVDICTGKTSLTSFLKKYE